MNQAFSLFLDERGPGDPEFYYLGGVLVPDTSVRQVADLVRGFKRVERTNENPDAWYMKATGKDLLPSGEQEQQKPEAFARWERWATTISKADPAYMVVGAYVLVPRYISTLAAAERTESSAHVYAEAMRLLLDIVVQLTAPDKLNVYIDHVTGIQHTAADEAVTHVQKELQLRGVSVTVGPLVVVSKDDVANDAAQVLQLVDMNVYALSRFMRPTGAGNILADFERWPFAHAEQTLDDFLAGTADDSADDLVRRYFAISGMYHHLRAHLAKNRAIGKSKLIGSFVVRGKETHLNFAADLDRAIWLFCNTGVWKTVTPIVLEQYE